MAGTKTLAEQEAVANEQDGLAVLHQVENIFNTAKTQCQNIFDGATTLSDLRSLYLSLTAESRQELLGRLQPICNAFDINLPQVN